MVNAFFIILGFVLIFGGFYWLWRASGPPEESDGKTEDDERLINVGWGQYQTENVVEWRGIVAVLGGCLFIVIGIVITI